MTSTRLLTDTQTDATTAGAGTLPAGDDIVVVPGDPTTDRSAGGAAPSRSVIFWIALAAGVAVTLVVAVTQSRITANGGRGYDGVAYFDTATSFGNGVTPTGDAPFVFRIATPYLAQGVARVTGANLFDAFAGLNLAAGIGFFVLLYHYLRRTGTRQLWAAVLTLGALAVPLLPVRFSVFDPVLTDPIGLFVFIAGLVVLERARDREWSWGLVVALAGLTFVGVLFREQLAVVAVAGAVGLIAHRRDLLHVVKAAVLGGAAGLGLLVTHAVAKADNSYSYAHAVVESVKAHSPLDLPLSLFMAFGVAAVLGLVLIVPVWRWLLERPHRLTALVAIGLLAWLGGTDTERFLVWGAPLLLAAVGAGLTRTDWSPVSSTRRYLTAGMLGVVWLCSVGFLIPLREVISSDEARSAGFNVLAQQHAVPLFSIVNSPSYVLNLTYFASRSVKLVLLAEWLVVTLVTLALLLPALRRRKPAAAPAASTVAA